MGARDPIIDSHDYVDEAVAAVGLVLPDDFPGTTVCLLVLYNLLGMLDREPVRQSDLDALRQAFGDAVDEMET